MKAGYLYAHHLLMEWANIPRDVGTGIYGDGYHHLIIKKVSKQRRGGIELDYTKRTSFLGRKYISLYSSLLNSKCLNVSVKKDKYHTEI